MASYIEANLGRDEHIIYKAQVLWWSQIWFFIIVILLIPAFIGLIFLILGVLDIMTRELALTNKRVIAKFGFIRRQTIEINLSQIESIAINQGVFGRWFDYGTVIICGTGGSQAPIPYIARPLEFRSQTNELLDEVNKYSHLKTK